MMWNSIQVLPNQVSKKSFYTFEDIDLREYHAKLRSVQTIQFSHPIIGRIILQPTF